MPQLVLTKRKYSSAICNSLSIPAANVESLKYKPTLQKSSHWEHNKVSHKARQLVSHVCPLSNTTQKNIRAGTE